MSEILNYIGSGSVAIVIILSIVEIVPIKINPVQFIGNRFNKGIRDDVKAINGKLDVHIADDMRTYIIDFQNQCLQKRRHTREEWRRAHNMCDKYETYVKDNKLKNSEADEAIAYIKRVYNHCLDSGDFIIEGGNEK